MSDLAEIRRELLAIRDTTARTAQDVSWIKAGMERGAERMDGHDKALAKLHNGQHRSAGYGAGIGSAIGIVIGALGAKFGLPPPHP